ncbi:MAG TPA: hypothetical protein VHA82_05275 [Ramlibacter sp.]|nr:hypothetical protein [Ramlibacter sp.]
MTLAFFLDANCVNARQKNDALNQLESYRDRNMVTLMYADKVHAEARHGSQKRSDKVQEFSFAELDPVFGENLEVKGQIEDILCPGGAKTANERNDIWAVYVAERLQWPLVTMDGASKSQPGGILGRAPQLAALGVEVITPQQALDRVRAAEHAV